MTQPVTEGMVPVQYADGTKEAVRPEDLGQAIRAGGKPLAGAAAATTTTPDTPAAEQFATFGLKGLDALTMGASDAFLGSEWSGAPVSNIQTANRMYEENPRAGMLGTIGGLVAGGGEMGALGGEAAGGLVTRGLAREGAGALEQFAVRRAADAARGAVEMMPINVGQQISEDALGDKNTNGEKILAAMFNRDTALGAGLGAGLGGGLEFAGRLIPKGVRATRTVDDLLAGVDGAGKGVRADAAQVSKSIDELQRAGLTTDQARAAISDAKNAAGAMHGDGMLSGVADALAKSRAGGDTAAEDVYRAAYKRAAAGHVDADEVLNASTRKLSKHLDSVFTDLRSTVDDLSYGQKPSQFERLIDPTKTVEARDALNATMQRVRVQLEEMGSTATKGGGELAIKDLGKVLKDADARIAKGLDAADSFVELEKIRKAIGKKANFGTPLHLTTEAQRAFQDLYADTRATMEDPAVWGQQAADANKGLNAAHTQALSTQRFFESKFAAEYGRDASTAERIMRADPAKVRGYLADIHSAGQDLTSEAFNDFISAQRNRAAQADKFLQMTAEERAAFSKGSTNLDELEKSLVQAREEGAVQARLKAARAEEQGHATHGLAGLVLDTFMSPVKTMDRLGALQHAIDRVTKAGKGHVDRLAEGAAPKAAKPMPRKTLEALVERVRSLAGNPDALASHAQDLAGDMPRFAPGHSAAVATQLSRAVMYLAAAAPKGWKPIGIMQTSVPTRYSDQDLSEFHEKAQAVLDPLGTIESGRISLRQMQAIRDTSPNLYAEWQDAAIQRLSHLSAAGKLDDMAYAQKLRMTIFLQVPADDTLTPDFIATMQQSKQQPAPGAQGSAGGGAPKPQGRSLRRLPADNMQTSSQKLEGVIK